MSNIKPSFQVYLSIGILGLLTVILPIISLGTIPTILTITIALWGIISINWPKIGLFLIIFLRPCLDIWTSLGIIKIAEKDLNFASILSILLLLVSGYLLKSEKYTLNKLPLLYPWLGFLGITFLSIIWSIYPIISFAESLRILSFFTLFFYAFAYVKSAKDLESLLKIIVASGVIPSAFALYQFITDTGLTTPLEGIYNRIYGTFAHPSLLAHFILLPIISTIYFVLNEKKDKIKRLTFAAISIFYTFILVLTFTRGAWLALFRSQGLASARPEAKGSLRAALA